MPATELLPADIKTFLAMCLMLVLFAGSVTAWIAVLRRDGRMSDFFTPTEEARATWSHQPAKIAVALAWLWFVLHFVGKFVPATSETPANLSTKSLLLAAAINVGLVVLLMALLTGNRLSAMGDFGLKWQPMVSQLLDGWFGFRLALIPMSLTMVLSSPFRTRETRNPLLVLLGESSEAETLILVFLLAAIIAPLSEELIFRVILQGSLSQLIAARWTIPIVAVAFCSVHGPVDGPALLPLALVLGWFFHRSHSYLTVVVIHGLFNASMLALAVLMSQP